jgi:hypothetical protein
MILIALLVLTMLGALSVLRLMSLMYYHFFTDIFSLDPTYPTMAIVPIKHNIEN